MNNWKEDSVFELVEEAQSILDEVIAEDLALHTAGEILDDAVAAAREAVLLAQSSTRAARRASAMTLAAALALVAECSAEAWWERDAAERAAALPDEERPW